jgi:hypothetical protein
LAEKDLLLKTQQQTLNALEEEHQKKVRELETIHKANASALQSKHEQEKSELEKQVEEAKKEAEANPAAAIDIDEHLERMLQEFESLEEAQQLELDHLKNDQKAQLSQLKRTQDLTRDSWTTRYLPTAAVSWPLPNRADASKLRPTTSLVESKSKTLLRVLGNMPGYQKPEPVLTPLDPKKVQVYYSSVSGNTVVRIYKE